LIWIDAPHQGIVHIASSRAKRDQRKADTILDASSANSPVAELSEDRDLPGSPEEMSLPGSAIAAAATHTARHSSLE
jgi:hypothetical protein